MMKFKSLSCNSHKILPVTIPDEAKYLAIVSWDEIKETVG